MSNIDKQALNQEKIEWLNKLADMEYCKSNPGHWLMSLKDTNMLAKLALRSVALLDEMEAAEKRIAELERKEQHSERQSVIDALAGSGEEWSDIEEYMQKWDAERAAMLQGSEPVHDVDNTNRQFESLGCAEDTSRRFKCTGLIVTSDERKMEIPHCSKHPETELQVNPFERLMSYPPQPVMYCPLCRPSVAERVEFDKQLRQWKEVK